MGKITIIEGNSSDKDNMRTYMVKGEKGDKGDKGEKGQDGAYSKTSELTNDSGFITSDDVGDIVDQKLAQLDYFPIGALYFTATDINPSTFLGGTWSRVAEGLFLVGVGTGTDTNGVQLQFSSGANDGEYEHIQTVGELATHNHTITDEGHNHSVTYKNGYGSGNNKGFAYNKIETVQATGTDNTSTSTTGITINNTGLNQGMNIVNPSFGMYVWQRTA